MSGEIKGLGNSEDDGEAEDAEEFEVDPGVGAIVVGDIDISGSHGKEKSYPADV